MVFPIDFRLICQPEGGYGRLAVNLAAAHSEVAPATSLAFASATLSTGKRTPPPWGLCPKSLGPCAHRQFPAICVSHVCVGRADRRDELLPGESIQRDAALFQYVGLMAG